jgi:hypothetical protein
MKESPREHFRWAPHTGGLATVKPRDYEPGVEVDAPSPYALWKQLALENSGRDKLQPGDVLELVSEGTTSTLFITKYIGFEPAQWFIPLENKSELVHSDCATA